MVAASLTLGLLPWQSSGACLQVGHLLQQRLLSRWQLLGVLRNDEVGSCAFR